MEKNKFCLACGAPHKETDYLPGQIKCSYCGFTILEKTPIENVKRKVTLEYYIKRKKNQFAMSVMLFLLIAIPVSIGFYGNLKNSLPLVDFKNQMVFSIFAGLLILLILNMLVKYLTFFFQKKFYVKYQFNIDNIKAAAFKQKNRRLEKRATNIERKLLSV